MKLFLLRHGETAWSRERRKQGRRDSPLTPLGLAQAASCAALLGRMLDPSIASIITSPLGRARSSAKIVQSHLGIPSERYSEAELLAEHDYGAWQGLTDPEIEARFPGELDRRRQNHWDYIIPNGESYAVLEQRIAAWLHQQPHNVTLIVVAHDMVSRVMRGIYLGLSNKETLHLTHPHTRIYLLENGSIRSFDAWVAPDLGSA